MLTNDVISFEQPGPGSWTDLGALLSGSVLFAKTYLSQYIEFLKVHSMQWKTVKTLVFSRYVAVLGSESFSDIPFQDASQALFQCCRGKLVTCMADLFLVC